MNAADAAAHLGVRSSYLNDVIAGVDGISADLALRLAAASGSTGEYWLGVQSEYDLALAADAGAGVKRLSPTAAWEDYYSEPWVLREEGASDRKADAASSDDQRSKLLGTATEIVWRTKVIGRQTEAMLAKFQKTDATFDRIDDAFDRVEAPLDRLRDEMWAGFDRIAETIQRSRRA